MDAISYVTFNRTTRALTGSYLQVPSADQLDRFEVSDDVRQAWTLYRMNATLDAVELIPPSPAPLPSEADYVNAIQNMLDTKVAERRYLNILSACSYAASTNSTFKAEADACTAWRDAVWLKAYSVLDQVNAGTLAQPSIPDLLAMLPALTWPT